jgi:hypothetical protein
MKKMAWIPVIFLALLAAFSLSACRNTFISDWWNSPEESPSPLPESEPEPEPEQPTPLTAVASRQVGAAIVYYSDLKSAIEAVPTGGSEADVITILQDISLNAEDSVNFYTWTANRNIAFTTKTGSLVTIKPDAALVMGGASSSLIFAGGPGGGIITIKGNVTLKAGGTVTVNSGVSIPVDANNYELSLESGAVITMGEVISYPSGTLMKIVPASYPDTLTPVVQVLDGNAGSKAANCEKFAVADQTGPLRNWAIDSAGELASHGIKDGDGSNGSPYVIKPIPGRVLDLNDVVIVGDDGEGLQYKLDDSIDYIISVDTPVEGEFAGIFDGNGKTIKLDIDAAPASGNLGMFEISDGTVKNLNLTGSLKGTGSYIGAVVGKNALDAAFINIHSSVNIDATTKSDVSYAYIGGIVGYSITGGHDNLYTTGSITVSDSGGTSNLYVGGICGYAPYEGMYQYYFINHSYSTSPISVDTSRTPANVRIGGIAGYGTIKYCAALNTSIRVTTGSSNNLGRVSASTSSLTNNYGKAEMTLYNNGGIFDPAVTDSSNVGLTKKHGATVSISAYNLQDWWTDGGTYWGGTGNAWKFGTDDPANPWEWDGLRSLPKLYFE